MVQTAIEKITAMMADCQEKRVPAEPIMRFLLQKCEGDEEFSGMVTQEHKTLAKCFSFVHEQACNHLDKKNGWIEDDEVYMMAVDYFNLDDEEHERKKAQEAEQREEERKQQAAESAQKMAETKELKAKEAKQKSLAKKINEDQLSLFFDE